MQMLCARTRCTDSSHYCPTYKPEPWLFYRAWFPLGERVNRSATGGKKHFLSHFNCSGEMRNGVFYWRHIQSSIIASSMEWTLGKTSFSSPVRAEKCHYNVFYSSSTSIFSFCPSFFFHNSISSFLLILSPVSCHFASSSHSYSLFQPRGVQVSLWDKMYSKWEAGGGERMERWMDA